MTQCLLDRPTTTGMPWASDWIGTFLHEQGDRWDTDAAVEMTSDAVSSTLAHTDHPVRVAAECDGKTAVVSVSAHTTDVPRTPWSDGSPMVEDLLGRLQRHTRHCGAQVRLTPDGSQTLIWFAPPRRPRGIGRLLPKA